MTGVSWLPVTAAGDVLTNPTGSALEGTLSDVQLQQLQQIAAAAAASSSSRLAAEAAAAAVLGAVGVGVKQLARCSLLADVLPTMEVQPLEALTARGGVQPGNGCCVLLYVFFGGGGSSSLLRLSRRTRAALAEHKTCFLVGTSCVCVTLDEGPKSAVQGMGCFC